MQERHKTAKTKAIIVHQNPTELVLNTAQMRSAVLVQQFRIKSPRLDAEKIVTVSVRKEIDVRKAAKKASEAAAVLATSPAPARAGPSTAGPVVHRPSPLQFQVYTP